jgi:Holliday junction resolvasome RuvABC endonuclease subunit
MPTNIPRLIIGLDPGLVKPALVVMNMDYSIVSTDLIKVEPSAAKRLWDIEQAVDHILLPFYMNYHITVFIEGYAYGSKFQRESLAEIGGVLRRYFYLNNLTYWVIPPTTNKLYVAGLGTANKNYMKQQTKAKWGLDFKSDDICDAHGLAHLGVSVLNELRGNPCVSGETEQGVVKEITNNAVRYKNANTAARPPRNKK